MEVEWFCSVFRVEERFEKARQRLGEAGQDDFEFDFMVTVTWTNTIPAVRFKPDSESVHTRLLYLTIQFYVLV